MVACMGSIVFGLAALAVIPSFAPAYIICLIVGGGLLVIATVFGGDGHDADIDVGGVDVAGVDAAGVDADFSMDADVSMDGMGVDVDAGGAELSVDGTEMSDISMDGAHHAGTVSTGHAHGASGALSLSNWFSVRFLVYFAATFGLVGTVLTYVTPMTSGVILVAALSSGLVVGQVAHQIIRALQRSSSDSAPKTADFVDQVARVTIAVRPPNRGEVAVRVGDREYFLAAASHRGDDRFDTGDRVMITKYAGGTAEVVSCEEYAFLKEG